MTNQHHDDDEITHYRARVDAIPTPEVTPEQTAMTDDSYPMRDSECFVHRMSVLRDRLRLAPATELHVACRDALDEITRQRGDRRAEDDDSSPAADGGGLVSP